MPKFKLICDHSCDLDTHVVTHEFNADYLPDVILNIDMFLKGAGFVYDGELGVDEPEEPQSTQTFTINTDGAGIDLDFGGSTQYYYDTWRNK